MKIAITVTKQEIEEAVRDYVFNRASTGYGSMFGDMTLGFMNRDGDVGNFTCTVEGEIKSKKSTEEE